MSYAKPCPQCPFARNTLKSYLDTRGQNGERFAGQASGPFALPCHMTKEFAGWRENPNAASPCVGAAIYRANCGYDNLPAAIPVADEPDTDTVFASPAELLAHHKGTDVATEQAALTERPVVAMLREELADAGVKVFLAPPASRN